MRKAIVWLLTGVQILNAAAITSNGTGGGAWNTGATWIGGVKPGNGDTATIVAGDTVTCTTTEIVGNSPTPGNVVLHFGSSGALVLNSGCDFSARGDVNYPGSQFFLTTAVTVNTGATFRWDGHLAGSPSTACYSYYADADIGFRPFVVNGGTLTSNLSGCPGYFQIASGFTYGGAFDATSANISYIGDATHPAFQYHELSVSSLFRIKNSTLDHVGGVSHLFGAGTGTIDVEGSSWTNTLGTSVLFPDDSGTPTSGSRLFNLNVFDIPAIPTAATGVLSSYTVTNNYFGDCVEIGGTAAIIISGNFFNNRLRCGTGIWQTVPAPYDRNYFFIDYWNTNPHWFDGLATGNLAMTRSIFELLRLSDGDSGDLVGANSANPHSISYSALLADETGTAISELISPGAVSAGIKAWNFQHMYWFGGYKSQTSMSRSTLSFGGIDWNEGGATPSSVDLKFQNSILFSPSTSALFTATSSVDVATLGTDPVPPANFDYNSKYNSGMHWTFCTLCTIAGSVPANLLLYRGYDGKWSANGAVPGVHDIDVVNPDDNSGPQGAGRVNPQLKDYQRGMALYDSIGLGHSQSPWVAAHSYSVGDQASSTQAGINWGRPTNYRTVRAHTSSIFNATETTPWNVASGNLSITIAANVATATVPTGSTAGLAIGDRIFVNGIVTDAAQANGTWILTGVTATTLSWVNTTTPNGTYTDSLMVMSGWENFWEFSTQYSLRQSVIARNSLITPMVNWIIDGLGTQNTKLCGTANDGLNIGPGACVLPAFVLRGGRFLVNGGRFAQQ